jgi:peptidoglycan hydrolase CwlO-like protein
MAGVVRFGLFVAIIALAALGFYANSLSNTVERQQATIASLTTERDGLKGQLSSSQKQASDSATALGDAETKIKTLQAELEEAKTPPARRRR